MHGQNHHPSRALVRCRMVPSVAPIQGRAAILGECAAAQQNCILGNAEKHDSIGSESTFGIQPTAAMPKIVEAATHRGLQLLSQKRNQKQQQIHHAFHFKITMSLNDCSPT